MFAASRRSIATARCLAALLTLLLAAAPVAAEEDPRLAKARAHLDAGQAEEALELLDEVMKAGRSPSPGSKAGGPEAEAFLLRSTGRLMLGDLEGGFADLERALGIDPTLRQAWLNLAGLEIAEKRYAAAYDALLEARKLDPAASDSYLNLGAVLLLQGEVTRAGESFAEYLGREGSSAAARYLVAANYALAGRQDEALEHLRQAIVIDERLRLRARADDRFLALDGPRFQELLTADLYRPPAGAHTQAAAFRVPYEPRDKRLLFAVLEALDRLAIAYDPRVETTAAWALVWADLRIKVHNQANGTGVVSLSAPAERFTAEDWQRRSAELFRAVYEILGE